MNPESGLNSPFSLSASNLGSLYQPLTCNQPSCHVGLLTDRSQYRTGINLLWAPLRSPALHQIALTALSYRDQKAIWIDATDTAFTDRPARPHHSEEAPVIARRPFLDRYQHHELVRQLRGAIDARTDLVISPAVFSVNEDDDVPSPDNLQRIRRYLRDSQDVVLTAFEYTERVIYVSRIVTRRKGLG